MDKYITLKNIDKSHCNYDSIVIIRLLFLNLIRRCIAFIFARLECGIPIPCRWHEI